jgi:hypothetical protein
MLYKSGINLKSGAVDFIAKNSFLTVFSAYLKLDQLKQLNNDNKIKQIIVRWDIQDLILGVSDIELYQYCKEQNIALFRNTRLHLKVFWNNQFSIFFGSANLTNKGLGELGNFNFELNAELNNISTNDVDYLNEILIQSEYVTEDLFLEIKDIINSIKIIAPEYPLLPTIRKDVDQFLISKLPLITTPDRFVEIYLNNKSEDDFEKIKFSHDLVLFDLKNNTNQDIQQILKDKFNSNQFILKFKNAVKSEQNKSMRFGAVRRWFSENTTTVPTPTTWDLTENVQILYNWICYFDSDYIWERPGGHSQVISYIGDKN